MQMQRIEDLDCLVHKSNSNTAVILNHGYGASMQDLAPLYQFLGEREYDWFFPDGPLSVDIGMGMSGKAWFPIDMMGLQHAVMQGRFDEFFSSGTPEGFDESKEKVSKFLKTIKKDYDRVFLGGFSQGSMMAMAVALENQDIVEKLILLSSAMVNKEKWIERTQGRMEFLTFQSAGIQDPVLPIQSAYKLRDFIKEHNSDHEFYEFQGGHEIPMPILEKLRGFLRK